MSEIEFVGYRVFRSFGCGLYSYSADYSWVPGPNEAACRHAGRPGHGPIPSLGCSCGFWIYKGAEAAARRFYTLMFPSGPSSWGPFGDFGQHTSDPALFGEVRLWGRVIEGDDGYRAQWAELQALLDIGQDIDLTPWCDAYDVVPLGVSVDLYQEVAARVRPAVVVAPQP
jgi:hypothetical protein